MSENKKKEDLKQNIELDNIIYSINCDIKIASVIGCKSEIYEIFIPQFIKYESEEYEVRAISEGAFKDMRIISIQFSNDSKLQVIEKEAFSNSLIESISIPSEVTKIGKRAFYCCYFLQKVEIPNNSKLKTIEKKAFFGTSIEMLTITSNVSELKEGWCNNMKYLNKIEVSPLNQYFKTYDEGKMIIGKSNENSNDYDRLIFCIRNIEEITIPNFFAHICSYSFNYCEQLQRVEFQNNSKLKTIDKKAFSNSSIESFSIPSEVIQIGKGAFAYCSNLQQIEIPDDSKLQTIEKEAFLFTLIESINITSKLTELEEGWCNITPNLTKIKISLNNPRYCLIDGKIVLGKKSIKSENYEHLVFGVRNIEKISIPSFIERICSCAFCDCEQIQQIEFQNDSKLQTIGYYAFYMSSIKSLSIPSQVTKIEKWALAYCNQLRQIEFPIDSKLQEIEERTFSYSSIESIKIPSEVMRIGLDAFNCCVQLYLIEFTSDSKLQTIEENAFNETSIEMLTITSNVRELKEGWCNNMKYLNKIEVSPLNKYFKTYDEGKMIIGKSNENSNDYDRLIFCVRNIEEITIPNFITHICSYSFNYCKQLQRVEFQNNSKLQTISNYSFSETSIENIKIPSEVRYIGIRSFEYCKHLRQVEISDDSKLQIIDEEAFFKTPIETFFIPSEVRKLKTRWCNCMNHLKNFDVSPSNQYFKTYEEGKIITGKSREDSNDFNCLISCVQNVKKITIPRFIEHICSYAFFQCEQLQQIEIQSNSKLQTIGEHAFCRSSIKCISIPSMITQIGENAFNCEQLQIIEINIFKFHLFTKNCFKSYNTIILMIPSHLNEN